MTLAVIELNDCGILAGDGGEIRELGAGVAYLDRKGPLLGDEARARARLHPAQIIDSFWNDLEGKLPRPVAWAATCADLAALHLQQIREQLGPAIDEVILAVPGHTSRESLGLLLGLASEVGLPVVGLVDAAVAATTERNPGVALLHLDVFLHEATLTALEQDADVSRGRILSSRRAGLRSLEDVWATSVAETFVRQTRFDPLHHAESEQAVYDMLPAWIEALGRKGEIKAVLELDGRTMECTLNRRQLVEAADAAWTEVAAMLETARPPGEPVRLQVTSRVAWLPGLGERLSGDDGIDLSVLPADAALRGTLDRQAEIRSGQDAIRFVTRLPAPLAEGAEEARPEPRSAGAEAPRQANAPTHLLYGAVAYAITDRRIDVGIAPPAGPQAIRITGSAPGISRHHFSVAQVNGEVRLEDLSRYGTFVNDRAVDGRVPLAVGDRIRIGSPGVRLLAVEVRDRG